MNQQQKQQQQPGKYCIDLRGQQNWCRTDAFALGACMLILLMSTKYYETTTTATTTGAL